MADLGHDMTEKELAALERRIKKVYGEASKDLQKKADEYFALFIERDKAQQELLEAGKITGEQYKQWRLAQIGRGKRFEALRDDVAKRMLEANRVAVSYVNDATPGIYSLNHNYAAYTIEQVAGDVGFTLYDEQTVKRLIAEDPTLLPKRRVDAPKDLKWNKKRFGAEITAGILMGEPIAKLADRVENLSDANRSGAIRNARTAVTGAQNAGRQESYHQAKKMGLQLRKRWIATKDMRTRHEHALLDGQTVALDEPFKVDGHKLMFPGDPTGLARLVWNCRCTMRTVEKEGIEAEPRQMRVRDPVTGRNEVVLEMTYQEWYDWKRSQDPAAFDIARKKAANEASDRKQHEKYRALLKNNVPKSFEEFQDIKYNNSEKWEYTKNLAKYIRKYPQSDKRYFDVQEALKSLGIKIGIPLPPAPKQAFILPEGKYDPYHIMHRMKERNITDDDVRSYMKDARCMFVQWGGQRQRFISDSGTCVITKSGDDWIYKTAWSKANYDEESDKIMEVLKNAGL